MVPSLSQWITNIEKAEEDTRKRKRIEHSTQKKSFAKVISHNFITEPVTNKKKSQSNKNFIKFALLIIGISSLVLMNIDACSLLQKCALLGSILTLTMSVFFYNRNNMKEIKVHFKRYYTGKNVASFCNSDKTIVLNNRTGIKNGNGSSSLPKHKTTRMRS